MKEKSLAIILLIIMITAVVPSFSFADNTSTTSIHTIQYGTRYSGTISADAKAQKYKVVLVKSGEININVKTYVNQYLNVEIYESNGTFLDSDLLSCSTGDYMLSYRLKEGTYFIKFEDPTSIGNYTFSIGFNPSYETYTYSNDFIKDVQKQAAISFNTTIYGQLALNDHSDVYKVELSSNCELDLKVRTYVNQVINILLYDSSETLIGTNAITNSKQNQTCSYNLKAGTYYFEFEHFACTGNYNFVVSTRPFEVKKVKVKPVKKGFIVTAQKNGTINGYEIRYSTDKKTWNIRTKSTKNNLYKKIKGLKSNKKYYVQVRQYRNSNGIRIYSKWSKMKEVR